MTPDIQALIEERPHLKDPLEFYAKWQHFHEGAARFFPRERSSISLEDSRSYSRENGGRVFQLFISTFNLSPAELEPLGRALEDGKIDFLRFPFDETPDIKLPISDSELSTILFLLSRPYFLELRKIAPQDGTQWKSGRCPLCSARPALSSITGGPNRLLHCSYCRTTGPYRFIGCPNCGNKDTSKLNTLAAENDPGFRVTTCDACQTYVKIVEAKTLEKMSADLADMVSLPLDIVAQSRQYIRTAPNPIGLKTMA